MSTTAALEKSAKERSPKEKPTWLRGLSGAAMVALLLEGAVLTALIYRLGHTPVKAAAEPAPVMLSFPVLPTPPAPPAPPSPQPVAPPPPTPVPQPAPTPPPPVPVKPEVVTTTPVKPVVKHEVHHREHKPEHRKLPPEPQPELLPEPTTPPAPAVEPPPRKSVVAPPAPVVSAAVTASFETEVRNAVQTALRYPAAARMMSLTGRTKVAFDYQDGQISRVRIVTSSGSDLLDRAALAAVHAARYPLADAAQRNRSLAFEIWVEFTLTDTDS